MKMKKGLLFLAFGGPRDEEEVGEFIAQLKGEKFYPELLQEVLERYRRIGGSPYYAILERVVSSIRRRIRGVEIEYGVIYGHPPLEEALENLEKRGVIEVVLFPLTPYRSQQLLKGIERLHKKAEELLLYLRGVEPWFKDPEYVRLWAIRIRESLFPKLKVSLLFTAHSVPQESSLQYLEDLEATVQALLKLFPEIPWRMGFHSWKEGWVGPSLSEALKGLKEMGSERVLVVPVGFVFDHLETLYDLDIALKEQADFEGIVMERVPCLNASEDFLNFLTKRVYDALKK
jgi:ferrochelatase